MIIRSVEYAGTVASPGGAPPGDLPQVAFSGRSNVGKSSLINTLLRRTRRKLARVSGEPGKTRALNFYRVNDRFFLVDLPGYGYARVPKQMREGWRELVQGYLSGEPRLRGVVHLVDSRREPTPDDRRMVAYLGELGVPVLIVLTKIDKLNRQRQRAALERAAEALGVDEDQIVGFSARTGAGREELMAALDALLEDDDRAAREAAG